MIGLSQRHHLVKAREVGGLGLEVKINAGATSSRIADACMAEAWANIASMNDGGSLSWSIEWAPMGVTAARAGRATPAVASARTVRPSATGYCSRTA